MAEDFVFGNVSVFVMVFQIWQLVSYCAPDCTISLVSDCPSICNSPYKVKERSIHSIFLFIFSSPLFCLFHNPLRNWKFQFIQHSVEHLLTLLKVLYKKPNHVDASRQSLKYPKRGSQKIKLVHSFSFPFRPRPFSRADSPIFQLTTHNKLINKQNNNKNSGE